MKRLNPDRVRLLLKERGESRDWLASECGVQLTTIIHHLNGKQPGLPVLMLMAKALNCSVEYLINESEVRGGDAARAS